jgi:hypothetical protein
LALAENDFAIAKLRKAETKTAEFSRDVPWTATGRIGQKRTKMAVDGREKKDFLYSRRCNRQRKTEHPWAVKPTIQQP